MKKFLVAMGLVAFAVVGCDDSSSASAGPNDEPGVESSSSRGKVTDKVGEPAEPAEVNSSSSEKAKTSSSDTQSGEKQSSSSKKTGKSSSSTDDASSSSEIGCKTETEDNCEYGELIDDRDGQVYKTVKIGDQWWMAENLNFDPGQGGSGENKYDWSWCYKDSAENCAKYGRLYTWAAAMDSVTTGYGYYGSTCSPTLPVQGICPAGWHLPSRVEWMALFMAVGGESTAGKVLKSQSGWYSKGNGTDAFGFSALPAGDRGYDGYINSEGINANFWSSTKFNGNIAYDMYLYYKYEDPYLHTIDKGHGFSVRCLKD